MTTTILVPEKKIEVPDDKESYFLGVGIDDWYESQRERLRTGRVRGLAKAAAPAEGKACYSELLLNEEATRVAIADGIGRILEAAPEGSLVTIDLEGHGKEGFFCAAAAAGERGESRKYPDPETGPYEIYRWSPLPYDLLKCCLAEGRSKKALVLHACHAGSFLEGEGDGYQGMFVGACRADQETCDCYSISAALVGQFERAREENGPGYGWREFLANDASGLDGLDPVNGTFKKLPRRKIPVNYVVKGAGYIRQGAAQDFSSFSSE